MTKTHFFSTTSDQKAEVLEYVSETHTIFARGGEAGGSYNKAHKKPKGNEKCRTTTVLSAVAVITELSCEALMLDITRIARLNVCVSI